MIDTGTDIINDPSQLYCVVIDARAPLCDGGTYIRVDCVSFGIVVNWDAERLYNGGRDFWPKRYVAWRRLVAQQPGQVGYSIIDSKVIGHFVPPVFPDTQADALAELALQLGPDVERFTHVVTECNNACQSGQFDHTVLDNRVTKDLLSMKTH